LGPKSLFEGFGVNFFYINTKAIVFLGSLALLFIFLNILLGKFVSNVKEKKLQNVIIFYITYSILVPFWVLKNIYNFIVSSKPSWR
ncbi:MAG: hypothetical protein U9R00_01395, partial [Patescibacteria group bacterium]|nr:hypothetical protein [Patescibacteria group bacterium]